MSVPDENKVKEIPPEASQKRKAYALSPTNEPAD
jgi:hypothetical protein